MLKYITKSRAGLSLGIAAWVSWLYPTYLLSSEVLSLVENNIPLSEIENAISHQKVVYVQVGLYSGATLFLTSLVLAVLGFKKEKWVSIITFAIHALIAGAMIATASFSYERYSG